MGGPDEAWRALFWQAVEVVIGSVVGRGEGAVGQRKAGKLVGENEPDPRYASVAAAMADSDSFRVLLVAVKRCAREMQASSSAGDSHS